MGFGIIKCTDTKIELLQFGDIKFKRTSDHFVKMKEIFNHTCDLIQRYHPDEMAIEAPFYGKNIQSMLKLGRAQGIAIAAALSFDIPIFEYSPKSIKQSITGSGSSSKEQVAHILKQYFKIKELPKDLDATDGLAAALCHYFQKDQIKKSPKSSAKKNSSSWSQFLNQNQQRIK